MEAFIKECERFFAVRRHKQCKRPQKVVLSSWNKLGAGLYGEAWQHAAYPNLVLKISGPAYWGYTHWTHEHPPEYDAWPIYARHAQQHPHEHMPKIMYFVQATPRMAWAIMPRYVPIATIPPEVYALKRAIRCGVDAPEWAWPLVQMHQSMNIHMDIHAQNVMWNPEVDTWVLTDPFSNGGDGTEVAP